MSLPDDFEGPLRELDFLARSANRVRVLHELTRGSLGRRELEATTGVTRTTLARILADFEERGWVIEDGRRYRTSQLGTYVARELTALLSRFEPVPMLNEVAQWFPEEGFEFDIGHLSDARIVRATTSNALAPTAHIADRVQGADRVQLLTYSVLPTVMERCWRGTVEGDLEILSVLDEGAFANVSADPLLVERAREMAASGRFEVYLYLGEVPSTVFVVDDAVLLCLSGDVGTPFAVIETNDQAVRAWAETTIDDHRRGGERIDPLRYMD